MAARPKRLILLAVLLAMTGGLKASGYRAALYAEASIAGDLQVSGTSGAPVTRIVSLVPALTEMLFAIGAGPQVVAVSSYDDFPQEVKALPRVGALLDPDVERILALRPGLVLTYGSQGGLEAQLARAGIRTFSYRHAGVAGVLQALRDLGAATGHPADGERKAREVQAQLDSIAPYEGIAVTVTGFIVALRPQAKSGESPNCGQKGEAEVTFPDSGAGSDGAAALFRTASAAEAPTAIPKSLYNSQCEYASCLLTRWNGWSSRKSCNCWRTM